MADEPKKPRSLDDLKERLGKGTPRRPSRSPAFPVASPKGFGGVPPVVKAPFGAPAAGPETSGEDEVFGVADGGAQPVQEVRLTIDEADIARAHAGQKRWLRATLALLAVFVLGALMGGGFGSSLGDRKLFNLALDDALRIKSKVEEATPKVDAARKHVSDALTAASGSDAKPSLDTAALDALFALEQPFKAGEFSRRRYSALNPATVDALFQYYNALTLAWQDVARLKSIAMSPAARKVLEDAAKSAGAGAGAASACIPLGGKGPARCALAFISEEKSDLGSGTIAVSESAAGAVVNKEAYQSGDLESRHAIIVDMGRSRGVLGRQTSAFDEYRGRLESIARQLTLAETKGREVVGELVKVEQEIKPVFSF